MTDVRDQQPLPPIDPAWLHYLEQLFAYDTLHIRQQLLTLSQKYNLTDENGMPRFFVVRPPRLAANLALRIALGIVRFAIFLFVFNMILRGGNPAPALLLLIGSNFVLGFVAVLVAPYRHIEVYSDETQSWRILTVTQDNKIGFYRRYTLYDCLGGEVARFSRNTLASVIRRDWEVTTPSGEFLFRVREDSWVRAFLRRYLGTMYGLLRTNFNFEHADGTVFGQYDRKLTLTDQYILNLAGDPWRTVDRRVTLAMSILLDTGESR